MSLLQARNLSLHIAGRVLCTNLNVEFRAGENWMILGANGSGKTTLLHTLAGLRAPDAGHVDLDGQPIHSLPHRARAKRLGILLQDSETAFPATVLETVLTGRHPHLNPWQWEGAEDRDLAEKALISVGMGGMASRLLNTLSGGERRRVEIATLLTQDAPLCLMDEPTNHLDLRHQAEILGLLSARARRPAHANIFVLHDVNLATRFGTHVILLFGDGAHLHGPMRDVVKQETLEKLYQCRLREVRDHEGVWYLPM
jgi:iron complex transport system ATP-binding protein